MDGRWVRDGVASPPAESSSSSSVMELGETEPDSAFGAYPFDASAVGVNVSARWPVTRRIKRKGSDIRALPPSPPPVLIGGGIGPSTGAHWPPSNRREEALALSNLEKRVGTFRVKNTSSFKEIPANEAKSSEDTGSATNNDNNNDDNNIDEDDDVDNRTRLLRKVLKNHPIYILTSNKDTETDWYTSDFISECLCWHNVYRHRHGVQPLALSPDLCSYAQDWANTLAHMNILYYRPDEREIGQNIYCRLNVKDPSDVTGKEVASYWYRACRQYDYLKEPNVLHANVNAGHFTQLIWAGTCDIGIGMARSRSGKLMVVANYRPRGNIRRQFQENVLPPILELSSYGNSEGADPGSEAAGFSIPCQGWDDTALPTTSGAGIPEYFIFSTAK